ncbi:MAG: DUF402 domain-containing protein [Chloroflexota bacterium]|nr:DUF402 domain-containing protein [Chloroflexota bacterium]
MKTEINRAIEPAGTASSEGEICTITSGEWARWAGAVGYRADVLSDILVERLVWGPEIEADSGDFQGLKGPGFVWFRFWVPRDQQIVERYFDNEGRLLGTRVDVCTPFTEDAGNWVTRDLQLDIWIDPGGRVTMRNEVAFEETTTGGSLLPEEADQAEEHVRRLTTGIFQGNFPPALVRNWQLDLKSLMESIKP